MYLFPTTSYLLLYLWTARLRLRIDCEALAGPGAQGGATEIVCNAQKPQAVIQVATIAPVTSHQPQAVGTIGFGRENFGNGRVPSTQEVLNSIALKCFQPVDPSKPEELNGFIQYMEKVRKVLVVDAKEGSLIITVECSSLQILDELWDDYRTGHLNEVAQKFLVREDILNEFGLIAVKLTTSILEEEYRACREYFLKFSGG